MKDDDDDDSNTERRKSEPDPRRLFCKVVAAMTFLLLMLLLIGTSIGERRATKRASHSQNNSNNGGLDENSNDNNKDDLSPPFFPSIHSNVVLKQECKPELENFMDCLLLMDDDTTMAANECVNCVASTIPLVPSWVSSSGTSCSDQTNEHLNQRVCPQLLSCPCLVESGISTPWTSSSKPSCQSQAMKFLQCNIFGKDNNNNGNDENSSIVNSNDADQLEQDVGTTSTIFSNSQARVCKLDCDGYNTNNGGSSSGGGTGGNNIYPIEDDGPPPNIIFLFADDVGFGDLACYGHPYAITPNLDRLAKEGTLFRQFHVTGSVCPTSRAGFMTSRNPSWFPNYTADFGFLNTMTITKLLHDYGGYFVGHIGKWNIGPRPADGNEDLNDRNRYGIDDVRLIGSIRDDPRGKEGQRFDEAIQFLQERYDAQQEQIRNDQKKQPFYLNVWIYATHTPVEPPDELIEPFKDLHVDRGLFGQHMQSVFNAIDAKDQSSGGTGDLVDRSMRAYLGEVYGMDVQIGRLLDKLDELGMADDTVVVFSSDNGPAKLSAGINNSGWAGGLRGSKHNFYEGGTREPFIVRWPNKVPAGYINNDSLMSGLDWFPTIARLAQVNSPSNPNFTNTYQSYIEGEDVSDIWLGKNRYRSRRNPLFWRTLSSQNEATMKYGPFKIFKQTKEMYDLQEDSEQEITNVYDDPKYASIRDAMLQRIADWESTLPTVHVRGVDGEPYPFDPTIPTPVIGPPDFVF